MSLRVISYGGGVQSTALLVLAAAGELGVVDAALFANVGDDSEDPETLRYVQKVAAPYAARVRVPLHILQRTKRDGTPDTVLQWVTRQERSIPIPMRMDNGAPGRRKCTHTFKVAVVGKWCRAHWPTDESPADVLIGISWDEVERVGNKRPAKWERPIYPLVDRRLTREDCKQIITRAGLPLPPKSSCFFCPFHRPWTWAEMRRDRPDLFQKSLDLERMLNERRATLGKDPVWLTRFNKPLDEAVQEAQSTLWGGPGETCDEGYCWT